MIILSITKFSSTTEHYYCKFYITYNAYIYHEDIKNGVYPLDEPLFHAMEKDCDAFQTIKDTNEHDLYVRAKKLIKENMSPMWWNNIIIYYEGAYSETRTWIMDNEINDEINN